MRHTVDNLNLAAEVQEVSLSAQLPDDVAPAQADAGRVAQVLRNLLVNALRHTPPGGSVTVSASGMIRTTQARASPREIFLTSLSVFGARTPRVRAQEWGLRSAWQAARGSACLSLRAW